MTGASTLAAVAVAAGIVLGRGEPLRDSTRPAPAVLLARHGEAGADSARGSGDLSSASVPAPYVTVGPADSVRVLTVEQWQWLARWFPGREAQFARIVTCESMWDDYAVGAAGERGRLQIMGFHAIRFGYSPYDLADPEVSGYVGARILEELPDGSAWTGAAGCAAWNVKGLE